MGILKLQDALKTIIIDNGDDILNNSRKAKAYLGDYTGDESKDELKILVLLLEDNIHLAILNKKEFDDQEQILFIRSAIASSYSANYQIANSVLQMLFAVFYDCNLIRRKITKNTTGNIIDFKIELWKKKLLDLGKRNRLLNYRDTKRSSLRFVSPPLDELWSRIVVKDRPLEFPYVDEFADNEDNQEAIKTKPRQGNVITNQSPIDQQKTLRNLKTKAKSINEEQGVNVLHLAFGFLKWTENNNSTSVISSPLLLVPVSISQKSISSPFVLTSDGDDVIVNPTLSYKMEHDFGIQMPEFDIDKDINTFFNDISSKIKNIANWSVSYETSLSLFSFLKINMYNDLSKNSEKIKKHPAIKALIGDSSGLMDPGSISPKEYDHDSKNPEDLYQVLDADSSQQDAIVSAKKGLSFVLQGPPGTGKSQTIANIIAECLASNKKVLFVSEKVAALDVVYRRLSHAGLNEFCLTLHSHKSKKKEIIDDIGKNLTIAKNTTSNDNPTFTFSKLSKDTKHLNEYSIGAHFKSLALQKSIYDIYGQLIKLEKYPDIPFSLPNVESITQKDLDDLQITIDSYATSFDKTSSDFETSPWKGLKIANLSYDFTFTLNTNIEKLLTSLIDFEPLYKEITDKLSLKRTDINALPEILATCSRAVLIYKDWLSSNNQKTLEKNVVIGENKWNSVKEKLNELYNFSINNKDIPLKDAFEQVKSIKTSQEFNSLLDSFKQYVRNDTCFSTWEQLFDFSKIKISYKELKDKVDSIVGLRNTLLLKYDTAILEIDTKSIIKRFQMEYMSVFKVFKKQYKIDKKKIIECHKNITKDVLKIKDSAIISDLQTILSINEIENWFDKNHEVLHGDFSSLYNRHETDTSTIKNKIDIFEKIIAVTELLTEVHQTFSAISDIDETLKKCFQSYYIGMDTDWKGIKDVLSWTQELSSIIGKYTLSKGFIEKICSENNISLMANEYLTKYDEKYNALKPVYDWYCDLFDDEMFSNKELSYIIGNIKSCKENIETIDNYINYRNKKSECLSVGLSSFIETIETESIKKENILPIFKKYFYKMWLDKAISQFASIQNFKRITHEKVINEYKGLDIEQLNVSTNRIREIVINQMPSQYIFAKGGSETRILQHEMNKKRRIMPIRKLFQSIPGLLPTLKPCLMMSPLTVSLFLESDRFTFDTIIFDEASQVCTENAIGAILRGKQVILAGDSKQLPPTTFFTAAISDSDYDEDDQDDYTDIDSYESILDEAEASSFPSQTLKWHYRSKHEHLIAFSNSAIYQNKLITFPSNKDRSMDNGVEYTYVENGIYDKGGRRDNVKEAEAVVDLIFQNIEKYPDRSLGVITFSFSQREIIDTLLRKRRLADNRFEDFFSEEKEGAFFIKNIETVQGDERDTIIFSIGYAKDFSGKMSMFFGPLSSQGGERRLNVAITRAKYNVKLVGSILPADIKIDRITSEGPKLLRQYIDFAINGPKVLYNQIISNDSIQIDSPFEQYVYDFLTQNGIDIATQVGCSGYRIDMAVRNPNDRSSFVLGIECDGATYHSARTARERDRLRQTILEDMGWKIYRIWSTEWIRNTKTEKERLLKAVEAALKNPV